MIYGVFEVINEGTSDEVLVLKKAFISEYEANLYANVSYYVVKPIYVEGDFLDFEYCYEY